MMNTQIQKTDDVLVRDAIVPALRAGLNGDLVALVLFGSRARADARETSDWDLLVIARGLSPRSFVRRTTLNQLLPTDWRGRIAMVSRTPDEFEHHLSSLHLDLALDGVVLWESDTYATQRLSIIRSMIASAGLERIQTADGHEWRGGHAWSGLKLENWAA